VSQHVSSRRAHDPSRRAAPAAPFHSPEEEAYLNVVRTAAVLADAIEQVMRPPG
jgi:hypothetical protein